MEKETLVNKEMKIMKMKFDIILANPPYDNGLGEKFFLKTLQIADINVSVLPATWLLGKKQNQQLTVYFDKFGGNIEQIFGTDYFDADIPGVISINYINQNNMNKILFDNKEYNKCEEITRYSNDELLVEFFNKVHPDSLKDNVQLHIKREVGTHTFGNAKEEHSPNDNWWIIDIKRYAGNGTKGYKYPSFYTIAPKSVKMGQYKNMINFKYYIAFNTERELHNFWNFVRTDFARICLYFIKNSMELGGGELKYIPWFDFSDPIFSKSPSEIDDYLFKKYNISDEIRKHIEDILPDYYNIRHVKNVE